VTHTVRLPDGWAEAEIGKLGKVITGSTPPTKQSKFYGGSVPFVRPQELVGLPIAKTETTLTEAGAQAGRVVPKDSVLVGCIGTLGKSGVTTTASAFNQQINAVIPSTACTAKWLLYGVQSPRFKQQMLANASATTVAIINKGRFSLLRLPVAPLPEQHRIVGAIESYLTRLDAAVALLERVQRNLKRYRASVLKAAVEGRLVPTEAELARREGRDYEPASELLKRILVERRKKWIENTAEKARAKAKEKARKAGKPWTPEDNTETLEKARKNGEAKYKEPVPSDTTDLPKLPEGWCWATIAQLASAKPHSLTDGPFGSNLKTEHYTEAGPRVIRLQNIGDGQFINAEAHISGEHYEQLKKHATYPGDVVIASLGVELPKACLVPERLGQAIVKADCLRLKPNARLVDRHYLMHALNSRPIRKRTEALVHGMGRPRIGLTLLRTIPVPLPPHAEQKRIANRIDTLLSITENMVHLLERQNLRTARLRQSILNWAFEGKLVLGIRGEAGSTGSRG